MQQVRGRAVSTRLLRAKSPQTPGVSSPSPLRSLCEGPVRKSPVKSALRRRQPPKSTYRAGERYAVHPRRRVGRPPKVGCRTPWPACRSCQRQWGAGARACSAICQKDGEWPETDSLVGCGIPIFASPACADRAVFPRFDRRVGYRPPQSRRRHAGSFPDRPQAIKHGRC